MDRLNEFLPEGCYEPKNLSMDDAKEAFSQGKTVIGRVLEIDENEQVISVRLGDDLIAKLPFSDATIYPYTYSKTHPDLSIPFQIACLVGKVICTKISNIKDDIIILSRKRSMLEAFDAVQGKDILPFLVTDARTAHVYGDVGYGLQARIFVKDLCKSRLLSTSEICQKGDCLFVKRIDIDDSKRFNVSYKETFPKYNPMNYNRGDTLTVRISNPVDNTFSGFFVYVTPQVCGILDYNPNLPFLRYGDTVECMVSRAVPGGLHLKFIRLVERSKF